MKKQLIKGTFYRFVERILLLVTSLILTPYMLDVLSADGYGLWLLIVSTLGWFNIINLGFPAAVQREITIALENNDQSAIKSIYSTALLLFLALGIVAVSLMLILASFPQLLGADDQLQTTLSLCLIMLSVKVLWDFLLNTLHGFFAAMLRFDFEAQVSSVNIIIKSVVLYFLIPNIGVVGAVVATLFADLLTNLIKFIWVKKNFNYLRFSKAHVSRQRLTSLFNFSKHVFAGGIAHSVNKNASPLIITHIFDLATVSIFGIANRLTAHVAALIQTISGVFQPVFTKKFAQGSGLSKTFSRATNINLFVACILFAPLWLFSESFILLWVGERFVESVTLMKVLIIGVLFLTCSSAVRNVLFAQANHKWLGVVNLAGAILNISLSIILASAYGLIGIAIASTFSFLVSDVLIKLWLVKRYEKIDIIKIVTNLLKCMIFIVVIGELGLMVLQQNPITNWTELVINILIVSPLILVIAIFALLDREIYKMMQQHLLVRFRR